MDDPPASQPGAFRLSRVELIVLVVLLLVGFGFSYLLAGFLNGQALQFIDKANHLPATGNVSALDFERARFNASYDFAAASLSTREWMRGIGAFLSIWLCLIGSIYVVLRYRSDSAAELGGAGSGLSAKFASSSIGLVVIAFGVGLFVAVAYWRPDVTFDPRPVYSTATPADAADAADGSPDVRNMLRMVDPEKCRQCIVDNEGDVGPCLTQGLCEVSPADPAFQQ